MSYYPDDPRTPNGPTVVIALVTLLIAILVVMAWSIWGPGPRGHWS